MKLHQNIIFGDLKSYSGQYAVVELPQFDDSIDDRTIEEIMVLTPNALSQNMPHEGDKVAVIFDEYGEALLLGSVHNEAVERPDDAVKNIVFDSSQISLTLRDDGKLEIKNNNNELIDLIVQLFDLLLNSTTATALGAQKLSIALPDSTTSLLGQLKAKVETFKV